MISKTSADIFLLDLDKIFEICPKCRLHNTCKRSVKNKKGILHKFLKDENIMLYSKRQRACLSYKDYSCALMHMDCPCMSGCVTKMDEFKEPITEYNFWTYCMP